MNKLPFPKRVQVLSMLCEGSSMRATSRVTGVAINTVMKLLVDAGQACAAYHDQYVRNLQTRRIECDEAWCFTYAKQKNVATAKAAPLWAGDVWTWTAIDADTKLIVSYFIGGREIADARAVMDDLKSRVSNRIQLTTDGHRAYWQAVEGAFGGDVDYAQLVKIYGPTSTDAQRRYSPPACIGARKHVIAGNPDEDHVSTSYVERQNLTMRMHMRRFTRLTNAFSKKIENHAAAVALHMMYYNFVRVHQTLRMSPAQAAGVTDKLWSVEDLVAMIEQQELANR